MNFCCCRFLLPILVIVFAWWHVSWGAIALTVIGVALLVLGLMGDKCCCPGKPGEKKE